MFSQERNEETGCLAVWLTSRQGPEVEVEDAGEIVEVGHGCHGGLDVAVFGEEGEGFAEQFEVAPNGGMGWFGLGMFISMC